MSESGQASPGGSTSSAPETTFHASGVVSFQNLMALRQQGEAAIADGPDDLVFDLSGLENGNSAGAALLMAWFRAAARQDKHIVFVRVPVDLRNIIDLSGLGDVLPVQEAQGGERDD